MVRRRKQLLPWLLSGMLLVAALGLVIAKLQESQPPAYEPPREHDPVRAAAQQLFQEAKNSIRAGQWTVAKTQLLQLQQMAPDTPGLQDYLTRAAKEVPNQEHLEAARKALSEKKLKEAKAELDQVSADTTLFEQVAQQKLRLHDAAQARAREAQALLDAHQADQAKALADEVIAVFPTNEAARNIAARVYSLRGYDDSSPPSWEAAVDQFSHENLDAAITIAKDCAAESPPCKSGLQDLMEFSGLRKNLKTLDAQQLNHLLELEERIQGPSKPSWVLRSERPTTAGVFYREALKAKSEGKWALAIQYAQEALQATPGHMGATRLIDDLSEQAEKLVGWRKGYFVGNPDPEKMIPRLKLALEMTAPDSPLHEKLKTRLEQLQK